MIVLNPARKTVLFKRTNGAAAHKVIKYGIKQMKEIYKQHYKKKKPSEDAGAKDDAAPPKVSLL